MWAACDSYSWIYCLPSLIFLLLKPSQKSLSFELNNFRKAVPDPCGKGCEYSLFYIHTGVHS